MNWQLLRTSLAGLIAVVAGVALIGSCVLWGRSLLVTDDVTWHTAGRMTRFKTSGGGIWFETRPWDELVPPSTSWQRFTDRPSYPFAADSASSLWERSGFLVSTKGYDLLLVAPYWSVVTASLAVFATLSTIALSGSTKAERENGEDS